MDKLRPLDEPAAARRPALGDTVRRTTVADLSRRFDRLQAVLADLLEQMDRAERARAPEPWVEAVLGKRAGLKASADLLESVFALLGRAKEARRASYRMERTPPDGPPPVAHVVFARPEAGEAWTTDVSKPTYARLRSAAAPVFLVVLRDGPAGSPPADALLFRLAPVVLWVDPARPDFVDLDATDAASVVALVDALDRLSVDVPRVAYAEAARSVLQI